MSFRLPILLAPLLMVAAVSTVAVPAQAQLFGRDGLFSRDRDNQPPANNRDVDDDPQRIERLENMVRQLTGQNEQLQFRVRQLEEQLRAAQGGAPVAAPPQQAPVAQLPPVQQPPQQQTYQQQQPTYQQPPVQQQAANQPAQGQSAQIDQPQAGPRRPGRGDAFDPTQNPNAPGVPKALGGGQMTIPADGQVGAPGGRNAGEPLDLANASPRNPMVPPPQGAPAPGTNVATAPPAQTPRDEFDLGIGYMQRKDYALAEETMRNFTQKYPSDRLVADAQYWLGESQYQRQQYRDAAESFLAVTSKYEKSAKAPDSLLRLGQSLAALKQKEAACAALGEVNRKYPKASNGVKQGVEREQKRVGC